MVFTSETKQLSSISSCFLGRMNDIYICEEISEGGTEQYTLCMVKNHMLAKRLTEYFENGRRPDDMEVFSFQGMYCIAFPYHQERKLKDFILTESVTPAVIKEICRKVVFECMSSKIPWQILYLILQNEYINMDKENRIYFTYQLNLESVKNKSETECAALCARYLEQLLEHVKYTSWSGYQLLKMKNKRRQYRCFTDLYQDIYQGTGICKTGSFTGRIREFLKKHGGTMLRMVKVLCILVGIMAFILIVSTLILGENPFIRIFINTFKRIGTESMLQ